MKKTVPALVLTALCTIAGGVLWHERNSAEITAAQLAPAEALLHAELPDIPATLLRWKETSVHQILQEPEVRAFLARAAAEFHGDWAGTLRQWERIRPRKAFLSVAALTNNMPHAVAGFAFDGDPKELQPWIAKALIRAQNTSPQGQVKSLRYRHFHIDAFSDRGITLAGCFAGNWYFVANDLELLQSTLDRYSGKRYTALAITNAYRQSQAALPPQADFRLFAQPAAISNKLLAHASADAPPIASAPAAPSIWRTAAAALATRLEGPHLHDTLVLCQPPSAHQPRPSLNGKTLGLTTPSTLFYGSLAPRPGALPQGEADPKALPGGTLIPTLLAALTPVADESLTRYQTIFGPEHALLLDWPEGTSLPHLFLASEIRDPARARHFTETLLRTWTRADSDGVSIWTQTSNPSANFHPAVALTQRHLLAGLSSESLKPFATHASQPPQPNEPTLARSPAYQTAMAGIAPPEIAIAYLDTPAFFDRLYTALRPAALLWGPMLAPLNRYADFTQLPSSAAISRHLTPICLTARSTVNGLVVETAGPVSFVEVGAALGAAAFYTLLPGIRENQPKKGLTLPPPFPQKPLSLPETSPAPSPSTLPAKAR